MSYLSWPPLYGAEELLEIAGVLGEADPAFLARCSCPEEVEPEFGALVRAGAVPRFVLLHAAFVLRRLRSRVRVRPEELAATVDICAKYADAPVDARRVSLLCGVAPEAAFSAEPAVLGVLEYAVPPPALIGQSAGRDAERPIVVE